MAKVHTDERERRQSLIKKIALLIKMNLEASQHFATEVMLDCMGDWDREDRRYLIHEGWVGYAQASADRVLDDLADGDADDLKLTFDHLAEYIEKYK